MSIRIKQYIFECVLILQYSVNFNLQHIVQKAVVFPIVHTRQSNIVYMSTSDIQNV